MQGPYDQMHDQVLDNSICLLPNWEADIGIGACLAGEDGVEVVPLELGQPQLVGDPALADLLREAVQQGVVAPPGDLGAWMTCKKDCQRFRELFYWESLRPTGLD